MTETAHNALHVAAFTFFWMWLLELWHRLDQKKWYERALSAFEKQLKEEMALGVRYREEAVKESQSAVYWERRWEQTRTEARRWKATARVLGVQADAERKPSNPQTNIVLGSDHVVPDPEPTETGPQTV